MKLESIALHHGYESEKTTKAATTPIYQTTSFTFDDTKHGADLFDLKVEGNIYTRIMNPTNGVLRAKSCGNGRRDCWAISCFWNGCNYLCHPMYYKNRR